MYGQQLLLSLRRGKRGHKNTKQTVVWEGVGIRKQFLSYFTILFQAVSEYNAHQYDGRSPRSSLPIARPTTPTNNYDSSSVCLKEKEGSHQQSSNLAHKELMAF